MKTVELTWTAPKVSQANRELIRVHVVGRNRDRVRAGLPPINVDEQVEVEVAELADAMFEDRLRPFVEQFYRDVVGSSGAGRIIQHLEVYRISEDELRHQHGIVRPRPVSFDLLKFMQRYAEGTLTEWGGCFTPT